MMESTHISDWLDGIYNTKQLITKFNTKAGRYLKNIEPSTQQRQVWHLKYIL